MKSPTPTHPHRPGIDGLHGGETAHRGVQKVHHRGIVPGAEHHLRLGAELRRCFNGAGGRITIEE